MKIAIFGDSFGDDHINWEDKNRWLDVGPSWVDYLKQFHEVDNFCLSGSNLYYSKKKFDNTDLTKYDRVIFLVTSPTRRWQWWPGEPEEGSSWNPVNTEIALRESYNGSLLKNHLTAMDLFFKYIYNESDDYFHKLMIESIKHESSNSFIIDVGYNSPMNNMSVADVAYFDNNKLENLFREGYFDARKCHLSEENNYSVGQYIHQCLTNNLYPTFKGYIINNPTRPFEYYFRKVNYE